MTIRIPGHSWITGVTAPKIEGWECYFVTHIGTESTTFHYRQVSQ